MFLQCFHKTAFFAPLFWLTFFLTTSFSNIYSQNSIPKNLQDTIRLQEAVIQATRTGERSGVPVSQFSKEKINAQYHAQDVPFLLSAVPSLVETSDAGTGIGYTGMRIRGSDPTRINVTLNGIPLNDAESHNVFWVDLPDLAMSAAEIQVQRGVGASTNGAGAFGASVHIDLSKIDAEPNAFISNTLGSFGTRKHNLLASTGLMDGRWQFSARLSKICSNGFIDRATANLDALHLTANWLGVRQTVQAHLISGKEKTYQAWNGVPATFLEDPVLRTFNTAGMETPDGVPHPNEIDDYTQRHHLLHYKIDLRRGLFLQLNGHYTRGFGFFEQFKATQSFENYGLPNISLGDSMLTTSDLIRRRWLDNHFGGGTFVLRWQPPVNPPFLQKPPKFTLGGAVHGYSGRHFGEVIWAQMLPTGARPNHIYYDNDAQKWDANMFLQTEMHWRGGWSGIIDGQWRRVDYRFWGYDANLQPTDQRVSFDFFNPKVGIFKKWSERWSSSAFFGIGNREPNRDDFVNSSPSSRPLSERLFDTEIGWQFKHSKWEWQVQFFHMFYENQLVLDGKINDVGAYIRTNVPRSHRTGVELEATITPHSNFQLLGNVSVSRNKISQFTEFLDNWDTGEQESIEHRQTDISFSPNVIARGEMVGYFLKKQHTQFSATWVGKLVGSQFLDNTSNPAAALDPYFVADFRMRWVQKNWLGAEISVLISVQNLLDAKFVSNGWAYRFRSPNFDERPYNPYTQLVAGDVYQQTGYFPQAGRHFMVTVGVRF